MNFLRTALISALLNLPLHAQPNPTASDAWGQIAGGTVAVYATVNNPSMYDIYIVSGKSDAAAKIELLDGDKPVTSIAVPAYGSAELKAGDEVKLQLETDGGVSIEIAAAVKPMR